MNFRIKNVIYVMFTKPAIFGSALILFDIYFIWYIQAVNLFQMIPEYVAKDT